MILAGDVGGTKTNLAVFDGDGERLEPVAEKTYRSREYPSFDAIVEDFVAGNRLAVRRACFGVAGPVRRGISVTPNLAWTVDSRRLADGLRLPAVDLINDLEANAYGIAALEEGDFAVLNAGGPDASGNAAIIAAGTGLGEAILVENASGLHPFATEGGHADFAPRDALESEMLEYLRARFGRVSYERVLSGPGLLNVYSFLRDSGRYAEPVWLTAAFKADHQAAVITRAARDRSSELCAAAVDLFCRLYGSEAGNLALKALATGGVYLGGGIAPKMLWKLREGSFMEAFVAKGRMRGLLEEIPVRVILNDKAALLGAARRAALSATSEVV
jgi:glucokinase